MFEGKSRVRMYARWATPERVYMPNELVWVDDEVAELLVKQNAAFLVERARPAKVPEVVEKTPPVIDTAVELEVAKAEPTSTAPAPVPEAPVVKRPYRINNPDWMAVEKYALSVIDSPGVILETGTMYGHSTRALLNVCAQTGCTLVTVDKRANTPHKINTNEHPELTFVHGDSVEFIEDNGPFVFALLDSDHSRRHVLNELRALVGKCKYVMVHDVLMPEHRDNVKGALADFGRPYSVITSHCGLAVVDMPGDDLPEKKKRGRPRKYIE